MRHTLATADEPERGAIQVALEIADSTMTYSYRYRNAFQPAPAVDLLVLDPGNPRGIAFQVKSIVRHAEELPMLTDVQLRGRTGAIAREANASIAAADAFALTELDSARERPALISLLDDIDVAMERIGRELADAYLEHLLQFRA